MVTDPSMVKTHSSRNETESVEDQRRSMIPCAEDAKKNTNFTFVGSVKRCWNVNIKARPDRWLGVIPLGKHALRKKLFQNVKYVKRRKIWMAKMKVEVDL